MDNPGRDRAKGLGVGLSIVQRCCRLLGLRVAVRFAPGRGSVFSFTLAAAPSQVLAALSEPAAASATDALHGLAVLLIEDDTLGREALAQQLTAWGADVNAADGVEAALALYPDSPWSEVIVADYRMAGPHTGVDAIIRLRHLAWKTIAACVITGDTDPEVTRRIQAAHLPVLQKPVRPAKLRALLRNLVRQLKPL